MIDVDTLDSYLVPAIHEPWSRELINRAKVWSGDRVLDVPCSTGVIACRIASSGARVTALDTDEQRIARGRQRAVEERVTVTWKLGSVDALPFTSPSFDLVTCAHGLAHARDAARAAGELHRVLTPGGRAVVAVWGPVAHQGPYAAIATLAARATGSTGPAAAMSSWIDPSELTKLLTAARFFAVVVDTVTRQVRVPDPRRFVAAELGADEALVEEALAAIAPFVEGDQLVFSMTAYVAVARVRA